MTETSRRGNCELCGRKDVLVRPACSASGVTRLVCVNEFICFNQMAKWS